MRGRKVKRVHPVPDGSSVVRFETYIVRDVLLISGEQYVSLEGLDEDYFLILAAFEVLCDGMDR